MKYKAVLFITMTREDYQTKYTFGAKLGLMLMRFLHFVHVEFVNASDLLPQQDKRKMFSKAELAEIKETYKKIINKRLNKK